MGSWNGSAITLCSLRQRVSWTEFRPRSHTNTRTRNSPIYSSLPSLPRGGKMTATATPYLYSITIYFGKGRLSFPCIRPMRRLQLSLLTKPVPTMKAAITVPLPLLTLLHHLSLLKTHRKREDSFFSLPITSKILCCFIHEATQSGGFLGLPRVQHLLGPVFSTA